MVPPYVLPWTECAALFAEHGVDLREQLAFLDGLDQVFTCTLAQGPDAIGFLILAADDDDRNLRGGRILGQGAGRLKAVHTRSEEHTSELQSLMRFSYAVFCLKQNNREHVHYNMLYTTITHVSVR